MVRPMVKETIDLVPTNLQPQPQQQFYQPQMQVYQMAPQPVQIVQPQVSPEPVPDFLNMDYFTNGNAVLDRAPVNSGSPEPPNVDKPKRGRPPKTKSLPDGSVVVVADDSDELPMVQSNTPYIETYGETNNMLRTTIAQIDNLQRDVQAELQNVRGSKMMKNKFGTIAELASCSSTLLSTKIAAIREINKSTTDAHNLDLRRIKDLKVDPSANNDDKYIMDLYNAFINNPMAATNSYAALGPGTQEISMAGNNINRVDIMGASAVSSGASDVYQQYLANMTPEQNRMRMERNPNIKTVVVYDQGTSNRHFDVIDASTGMSVPNMPVPPAFLLDNMTVDPSTGTARNSDVDMDFPLMIVGAKNSMHEF